MKDIYSTDMLTIREAVRRAESEGIKVAEACIRRLVKDGSIHSIKTGAKYLLYYPGLVKYLTGRPYQKPTGGTQIGTRRGEEDES